MISSIPNGWKKPTLDFNVHLDEDGNISITMDKKSENKEENKKNGHYLRREFSYSKFQQTMVLPDNVDKEKISASVKDGVLTIDLPKLPKEEPVKRSKQIEIK